MAAVSFFLFEFSPSFSDIFQSVPNRVKNLKKKTYVSGKMIASSKQNANLILEGKLG